MYLNPINIQNDNDNTKQKTWSLKTASKGQPAASASPPPPTFKRNELTGTSGPLHWTKTQSAQCRGFAPARTSTGLRNKLYMHPRSGGGQIFAYVWEIYTRFSPSFSARSLGLSLRMHRNSFILLYLMIAVLDKYTAWWAMLRRANGWLGHHFI